MRLGLGLGLALRGNTPKHASKHTKHARKHNEQTCNICQNRQQHIMPSIVGRGWQWMPKVDIYGWECGWWDLRAWWGTGMGLGGAQVVVEGKEFGHAVRA